jgi:hypothetical protein
LRRRTHEFGRQHEGTTDRLLAEYLKNLAADECGWTPIAKT